jgi:hypothetical protein
MTQECNLQSQSNTRIRLGQTRDDGILMLLYSHEIFPIYPSMEVAIIAAIGVNTKLRRSTMKATEWKPYESYVVLRRFCGFLPLPNITLDFVLR